MENMTVKEILEVLIRSPYLKQGDALTIHEFYAFVRQLQGEKKMETLYDESRDWILALSSLSTICRWDGMYITKLIDTPIPDKSYQVLTEFFQIPEMIPPYYQAADYKVIKRQQWELQSAAKQFLESRQQKPPVLQMSPSHLKKIPKAV